MNSPEDYLQHALAEARLAFDSGEVPIGAIVVHDGKILARAHNTREQDKNPLHHAEIKALEQAAAALGNWRLSECELYVTLEPCPMCLGALFQARIGKLFFGCYDEKRDVTPASAGRIFPNLKDVTELSSNNHKLQIHGGLLQNECSQILKDFFLARRTS